MKYKIIASGNTTELSIKIEEMVDQGWEPVGSHHGIYRTVSGSEYSILMKKDEKVITIMDELVSVLQTLRDDAQMALDGSWDCSTTEGRETGFEAQLNLIDDVLGNVKD